MIVVYSPNETNFEHNGLSVLDTAIREPVITWSKNGMFSFTFSFPLNHKSTKHLVIDAIIKADDPECSNLFYIVQTYASMGVLEVVCYHITYQLALNLIEDINLVDTYGDNAIKRLLSGTQFAHNFTASSDIVARASSRIVRMNPIEALMDVNAENSLINRWGGCVIRQGSHIMLNTAYGSDKGYTIRYRKDLLNYKATIDFQTIVTRILPIGFDGLMLDEKYVDSPYIGNYVMPKIREIKYDWVKVKENAEDEEGFATLKEAQAELKRLALLEYSKNKLDVPQASYTVEFAELSQCAEYADLKYLKQIMPGDTVHVVHDEDNLQITAEMVAYSYNPLLQAYNSVTLGNYTPTFTSITAKISRIMLDVAASKESAEAALTSANGKNTNFYGTTEPSNPREGDTWFKQNGDQTEIWIYTNVNGELMWVCSTSEAIFQELLEEMEQMKQEAATAIQSANDAVEKANEALGQVASFEDNINQAKSNAADAVSKALEAQQNAQAVVTSLEGLEQRTELSITSLNNELLTKANTTEVDALKTRVSVSETNISQNSTAISLKASQTEVNLLTNRVSLAESSLTLANDKITALASRTDGQDTRLSSLEITADGLFSTVSNVKTEMDNLSLGGRNYATLAWQGIFGSGTTAIATKKDYVWTLSTSNGSANFGIFYNEYAFYEPSTEYVWQAKIKLLSGSILQIGGHAGANSIVSRIEINGVVQGTLSFNPGITMTLVQGKTYHIAIYYKTPTVIATTGTHAIYLQPNKAVDYRGIAWSAEIWDFKIEKGNKMTDWSPAPEDYTTVTEFSTLNQTVNAIQGTVANKAEQSQVTQMAGQITSVVSQTELDGLKNIRYIRFYTSGNSVNTGKHIIEVKVMSGTTNLLKGKVGTGLTPSSLGGGTYVSTDEVIDTNYYDSFTAAYTQWDLGKQYATLDSIQFVLYYKDLRKYNNVIFSVSPDGTNWKEVYNTPQFQTKAELEVVPLRTAINNSQITQLVDNINLRVQSSQVINQINISSEGILIAGNKIWITGTTKIDNGVIKTAHIGTAQIGSAQIADAAITNAKIANLDVAKITGNTSNFIKSLWNGLSTSLSVESDGLRTYDNGKLTSVLNGGGHTFKLDNLNIGTIGTAYASGNTSMRGLAFFLEKDAEFMDWAQRTTATGSYASVLRWNRTSATGTAGLVVSHPATFTKEIYVSNFYTSTTTTNGRLNFWAGTLSGTGGSFLTNTARTAGIFISADNRGVAVQVGGTYKWL